MSAKHLIRWLKKLFKKVQLKDIPTLDQKQDISVLKCTSCRSLNNVGNSRGSWGSQAFDGHLRLACNTLLQLRLLRLQLVDVSLQGIHGFLKLPEDKDS